ncbi:MAG: T9SS type A sorting domain-containing protein [Bacteroidota bacterium]
MNRTIFYFLILQTWIPCLHAQSDLNPTLEKAQAMTQAAQQQTSTLNNHLEEMSQVTDELTQLLSYLNSDAFLSPQTDISSQPLTHSYGDIEAFPTTFKFNGARMYQLQFDGQWITSQNLQQEVLYDRQTLTGYQPLGVFLKGKELYVLAREIQAKPIAKQTIRSASLTPTSNLPSLDFFPNPANRFLNVKGAEAETSYTIYNLSGQQIIRGILRNGRIDIRTLDDGVYILQLGESQRKFIKQASNYPYE